MCPTTGVCTCNKSSHVHTFVLYLTLYKYCQRMASCSWVHYCSSFHHTMLKRLLQKKVQHIKVNTIYKFTLLKLCAHNTISIWCAQRILIIIRALYFLRFLFFIKPIMTKITFFGSRWMQTLPSSWWRRSQWLKLRPEWCHVMEVEEPWAIPKSTSTW